MNKILLTNLFTMVYAIFCFIVIITDAFSNSIQNVLAIMLILLSIVNLIVSLKRTITIKKNKE